MARYNIETFYDDLISKIKLSLNTCINQINTEKGDSLLSTVNDEAYYFNKKSPVNQADNPFVYYEAYEDVSIDESTQSYYTATYEFEIGIAFRNNNHYSDTDEDNFKRVMRYQRAFAHALLSSNDELVGRGYGNLNIISIKSSKENRDEELLHVSAFTVQITIGN